MKTTSLELSKELKNAGAKQESKLRWCESWNPFEGEYQWIVVPSLRSAVQEIRDEASTFDHQELLGRIIVSFGVGVVVEWSPVGFSLTWKKVLDNKEQTLDPPITYSIWADKEVNTEHYGKLYLWGLQNGHCEKGG